MVQPATLAAKGRGIQAAVVTIGAPQWAEPMPLIHHDKPFSFGVAVLWGLLLSLPGHAQEVDPFRTRNLSPLASIFGVPSWDAATAPRSFAVTSELANHYRASRRGTDVLILDGETWRTNLSYQQAIGEAWFIGAELPYYRQSGGVLDDLVDGWHSFFSLPDGGRNARAEGELLFQAADHSGIFLDLNQSRSAWGDMQLSIGHRMGADSRYIVEATVKLATGDEDLLAGSGATDWAISLFHPTEVNLRNREAGYFWGLGLMRNGDPKGIRFEAESMTYYGILGGTLKLLPRWGIKGQLDVHTAFFDTPLEELGQTSVQIVLGGWWEMSRRGVLEFAVNEDLHVSTAPDVVLHIGLNWKW